MRVFAVVEQVIGELSDVDEAPALFAVGQQLALGKVVLLDLVEGLVAVFAVFVLSLLLLLLGRICWIFKRLFVDGFFAVGEIDVVVIVPAAFGLLHLVRLFVGLQHINRFFYLFLLLWNIGLEQWIHFMPIELLLQFGIL